MTVGCRLGLALLVLIATGLVTPSSAFAQGEAVEYYGLDALGSVRIVFRADGATVGRKDYTPFGEELSAAVGLPTERFAELSRDGEAGFDYARARSYQPRTGRFSAADAVYSGLFQPQAWNRYSYALNNPLSLTDPDGLNADACTWTEQWVEGDGEIDGYLDSKLTCKANYDSATGTGGGSFWDRFIWSFLTIAEMMGGGVRAEAPGFDADGNQAISHGTAYRATPELEDEFKTVVAVATLAAGGAKVVAGAISGASKAAAVSGTVASTTPNRILSSRVLERAAQAGDTHHNFPGSFDTSIFEQGTRTVVKDFWINGKPLLSNDSVLYRLPGSINGQTGTFEIFTRPSSSGNTEVIMHRFFKPGS